MRWMTFAVLLFLSVSCSTTVSRIQIAGKADAGGGGVRFRIMGDVPPSFRTRLLIRFAAEMGEKFYPAVRSEVYRVDLRFDPVDRDFTPIFFIVPPLLSYLGCPQGTVSRRFSIRIVSARSGKLLSIYQGRVRRPFGLYYMIPAAEKKMYNAILKLASDALVSYFRGKP